MHGSSLVMVTNGHLNGVVTGGTGPSFYINNTAKIPAFGFK
jgi:hypothetical protein